jgi:hypothetical protein
MRRRWKVLIVCLLPLFVGACGSTKKLLSPPLLTSSDLPPQVWEGSLNARGGDLHEGSYTLTLWRTERGFVGQYRLEGDRCIAKGQFLSSQPGDNIFGMVFEGPNEMELRATIEGGTYFGTYRFTNGPCKREWGSTSGVAKR